MECAANGTLPEPPQREKPGLPKAAVAEYPVLADYSQPAEANQWQPGEVKLPPSRAFEASSPGPLSYAAARFQISSGTCTIRSTLAAGNSTSGPCGLTSKDGVSYSRPASIKPLVVSSETIDSINSIWFGVAWAPTELAP